MTVGESDIYHQTVEQKTGKVETYVVVVPYADCDVYTWNGKDTCRARFVGTLHPWDRLVLTLQSKATLHHLFATNDDEIIRDAIRAETREREKHAVTRVSDEQMTTVGLMQLGLWTRV